jgi:hypothetical protein
VNTSLGKVKGKYDLASVLKLLKPSLKKQGALSKKPIRDRWVTFKEKARGTSLAGDILLEHEKSQGVLPPHLISYDKTQTNTSESERPMDSAEKSSAATKEMLSKPEAERFSDVDTSLGNVEGKRPSEVNTSLGKVKGKYDLASVLKLLKPSLKKQGAPSRKPIRDRWVTFQENRRPSFDKA